MLETLLMQTPPLAPLLPTFGLGEFGSAELLFGALLLMLVSSILTMLHKNSKIHLIVSTIALFLIIASCAYLFTLTNPGPGALPTPLIIYGVFIISPFSAFFIALFAAAILLVNIMSYRYSSDYNSFSLLLAFAAIGAMSVAMANSVVMILLGIELVTLPTAFMIMMNGKQYIEPAVKLFIISAIGVTMLTFAIALVFPFDSQLMLSPLVPNSSVSGNYLVVLALVLFIAGLSFDASLFPFNLWVPDVYAGSPANITAFLAGVNKKVAFVALFQILFILMLPYLPTFALIFQVFSILTMFFGNIAAMVQENVKRLFAYSAISQAGYIAIGFATASAYAISASMYQIVAHTFMIIGTFAIVLWLENKNIKSIEDYSGISTKNPFAAIALSVFMLSMIGVPPLMGFVGKFLLFTGAINKGLIFLTVLAIINSFISVYYYAKLIIAMFAKKEKAHVPSSFTINIVVWACLIIIIMFGIYPQPLISITNAAANALLGVTPIGILTH